MRKTACMRRALCLAAIITAVITGNVIAADQKPGNPSGIAPSSSTPAPKLDTTTKGKKRETYPFRGVIASIDATSRTVTLAGKQTKRVIQVTDLTRFERQGQPVLFEQLKEGEAIGGTLKKSSSGQEEALLIRVNMRGEPGDGPEEPKKTGKRKASEE